MAPTETFRNLPRAATYNEGQYEYSELEDAVRKVCEKRGVLSVNQTEDDQTVEQHLVLTVGLSNQESYPVILIGFDASRITVSGWIDTDKREHKLIVPDNHPEIIDEVKADIERRREVAKFSTATP